MCSYLLELGYQIIGVVRTSKTFTKHAQLHFEQADLLAEKEVQLLIKKTAPDYVIHLAAINDVPTSWANPLSTLQTNVMGTCHLLEAIKKEAKQQIKGILITTSALQYQLNQSIPIHENTSLRPTTPYGWSKLLQEQVSIAYAELFNLPIIIARTFNLFGPGPTQGVNGKIAQRIVEMEAGLTVPILPMGNDEIERDFLDVRDAVKAYWSLLTRYTNQEEERKHDSSQKIFPGEIFNVCSGRHQSMKELVEIYQKYAKIPFSIKQDPELLRINEPTRIIGDRNKITAYTGWNPQIPIQQTIKDTLEYYRNNQK